LALKILLVLEYADLTFFFSLTSFHSIYFDGSSMGITGKMKFPKDESCATKYPKEEVCA
jgi:hypothetical protein